MRKTILVSCDSPRRIWSPCASTHSAGPLAVDVGPELGIEVAQQEAARAGGDFRVMAGHTDARDLDVALGAAAKRENGLVDRNLAAAARIGDDETWSGRHPGHYSLTGAIGQKGPIMTYKRRARTLPTRGAS